jgi:hypothetical protein
MPRLETLFFTAVLGLAGLGIWNFRHWFVPHADSSVATGAAAAQPASVLPKKHLAEIHDKGRRSSGLDDILNSVSTSIVEVSIPRPRFPEAKDLRTGVTGSQIQAEFGEPTVRVTGTKDGLLVQQFYYVNNDHTRVTVANLQDGVVVSVASKRL